MEALKRTAEDQMKGRDASAKAMVRSLERSAANLQQQLGAEVERADRLEKEAQAAGAASREEFSKSQTQLQSEVRPTLS
jgi:predicted  nucleic acid-binding Zn-ribbon protein